MLFTVASLACGLAPSQVFLIAARAIQGFGGAIVAAVALSLVMNLFTKPVERAKAMGIYGFVNSGGGSLGVLLGGILTNSLDWHWIFLVNLPLGIGGVALSLKLLPTTPGSSEKGRLDTTGAITVTAGMLLAVYAIVNGNQVGWTSPQTLGQLSGAAALLILFLIIESRVKAPLMPLRLFKLRNLATANAIGILWAGGVFAWFFLSALYLQLILGYTPLQVGLSFLPANLIMAAFSLGLSAKLVVRFGIRGPLTVELLLLTIGLALLVIAPVNGSFLLHVLPSMIILGIGSGMAFNPLLLAAMSDVPTKDSGLASGIVNTSFMMGGALGLAVLASLAAARTATELESGLDQLSALLSGYHMAFLVGALIFTLTATILAATRLQPSRAIPYEEESTLPHH
ncbi:MAG: hypothetical protein ACD_28C00060G0006 [uncultured bacterium]|nr:MAG: hypothetical protein ACD_28C00060G0006 [uncultured bacterium]